MSSSHGSPDEMQTRIDRLENLVLSLMTNGDRRDGKAAAAAALSQAQASSVPPNGSVSGSSTDVPVPTPTEDSMPDEMMEEEMDHDVEKVAKSIGVMKVDSGKSFYVSEAHWYSILAEVGGFILPC